ncbi:MAG: helix-turn-helix transcriptional regulator, partial [Myxococcales bacterium]|nr:helix-turn-helix transcriptional regulator [Myxococcales bacterium]
MNAATALRFAARTAPAAAYVSTPSGEEARCVRLSDLLAPLVAALEATFSLSTVEVEILRLLLANRSCARIAQRLSLRETTVHKHLHRICAKTNTNGRDQLFDLGLRLSAREVVVSSQKLA